MKDSLNTNKIEHELSLDSSAWVRSLRQLLKDGKPTSNIVALTISIDGNTTYPFGLLARTGKNRLIFWPVLPDNTKMVWNGIVIDLMDHITLEFPSKKIHMTGYDQNNEPIRHAQGWKTHYKLEMWFSMRVQL